MFHLLRLRIRLLLQNRLLLRALFPQVIFRNHRDILTLRLLYLYEQAYLQRLPLRLLEQRTLRVLDHRHPFQGLGNFPHHQTFRPRDPFLAQHINILVEHP